MVAGGKRKGAGRKTKEPTKQVRIPVSASLAARGLSEFFLEKARRIWAEKYGQGFNVYLAGVEIRKTRSMIGTTGEIEALVCHAEKDNLRAIFTIDFDTGREGFQYEDEVEI
jgi:hypothetical protein